MAEKVATSGVDLSGLSVAKLTLLQEEVSSLLYQKEDEKRANALAALKESGKLGEMKAAFKSLKADYKALDKSKFSFTLTIPVEFTIQLRAESDLHDLVNNGYYDDAFYYEVKAKVVGDTLTKKQKDVIGPVVEDYAHNACDAVFDLCPEEFTDRMDLFSHQCESLTKLCEKHGLAAEDLGK